MTVPTGLVAVLSLGSNLGDRLGHLRAGVEMLRSTGAVTVLDVSPVYETTPVLGTPQPVGGPDQDDYLNAVVRVVTGLGPLEVLDLAHDVECSRGRRRDSRWAPRTLDVDLVDMGGVRMSGGDLTLPHPRASSRAFVLAPWLDLDPDAVLAGAGRVADLLDAVGRDGLRRSGGSLEGSAA